MKGRQKSSASAPAARTPVNVHAALSAALVALYVARPLLPSEGAVTADGEGLPFVLLMLALGCAWLVSGLFRNDLLVRPSWADAAWLLLLGCLGLSTWRAAEAGAGRSSINYFWEWCGLGVGFFLTRQLIGSPRQVRAAIVAMLGLAAALSAFGLHEYLIGAPETVARYREDPERLLRELHISAEPGSAERLRFEKRLESTEPMATFALANSLAGVLAPWLIMAAGIAVANHNLRATSAQRPGKGVAKREIAGLSALILLVLSCLLLTKSRSAWLATMLGAGPLALWAFIKGRRLNRRVAAAVCAGLISLATAAVATGSFDRQLITEAGKSLSYRWQYWQASLAMISDYPALGCGPGNFQDYYAQYKLPEASEVVADPHNLLLEVWATGGTPAALAFSAIFIAIGFTWLRSLSGRAHQQSSPAINSTGYADAEQEQRGHALRAAHKTPEHDSGEWRLALWGGTLGGYLLAFLIGLASTVTLSLEAALGGLAVSAASCWLLSPWVRFGPAPSGLPLLAAAALLINLLAAGGISFPGVAGSLWFLLALGLSLADTDRPPMRLTGWRALLPAGAAAATLVAFVWTDYLPVMRCRLSLLQAESADARRREELLQEAAKSDPRTDEPWRRLAAVEWTRWMQDRSASAFRLWQQATAQANQRRPRSAAAQLQTGNQYWQAYRVTGHKPELREAIECYQRAAELYPNYAEIRARLALALAAAGESSGAKEAAEEALRLNQLTPHEDQKLSTELLKDIERIQ